MKKDYRAYVTHSCRLSSAPRGVWMVQLRDTGVRYGYLDTQKTGPTAIIIKISRTEGVVDGAVTRHGRAAGVPSSDHQCVAFGWRNPTLLGEFPGDR